MPLGIFTLQFFLSFVKILSYAFVLRNISLNNLYCLSIKYIVHFEDALHHNHNSEGGHKICGCSSSLEREADTCTNGRMAKSNNLPPNSLLGPKLRNSLAQVVCPSRLGLDTNFYGFHGCQSNVCKELSTSRGG